MDSYKPIACGDYDILEIICMDTYDVEVITNSDTYRGIASDIKKQEDGEYLILTSSGTEIASFRSDKIVKINVLTRPSRFSTYDFR